MTTENALKIIVDVLEERHIFSIENLTIGLDDGIIIVTGFSQSSFLENITNENALQDLLLVKEKFTDLLKKSKPLADFIKSKEVKYCLNYDTGKSSVNICEEIGKVIVWNYKSIT